MGFLAKYFGLVKFVQQNNNYVVFDDYFQSDLNESQFGKAVAKTSASGWGNPDQPTSAFDKSMTTTGSLQLKGPRQNLSKFYSVFI